MRASRNIAGTLATVLATTLMSTAPAQSQDTWRGVYIGGGGTYSTVSVEVGGGKCYDDCYWWGDYDYYEEGDGDFSYALHAGWRINPFVALELGYVDTATIRWDEYFVYMPEFQDFYDNEVEFSAQVPELSVLGILPFADIWEIYARLGVGFWDGTSKQRLSNPYEVINRSVDDSGADFLFGLGAGVTVAEGLHLRLDFQTLTIDGDVLNTHDDASLDTILFELQYRFGSRGAAAPTTP